MARSNPSQKGAEIVVAALFFLFGAIVVFDSVRLGARWGEDGPQAGYFPFYIGLLVCFSAVVNLAMTLASRKDAGRDFVELQKLQLVLKVLVPSAIYVFLISGVGTVSFGALGEVPTGLGIYVTSALFIGFFMRWLGKYAWWKVAAVSVGTMVAFFLIFESWFKVPLPKGPLENLLGLG